MILTARRKDLGSASAAKLKNASFLELDITDDSSVARAAKGVPKLDVLINNAAIIADGDQDILAVQPDLVARTIATRHRNCCQFGLPWVVPHRDGRCNRSALRRGGRGWNRLAGG